MKNDLVKKLQLGLISFSTIALLAACGNDVVEDPALDDDPGVEEPADMDPVDEDDDAGAGGGAEEEEEDN